MNNTTPVTGIELFLSEARQMMGSMDPKGDWADATLDELAAEWPEWIKVEIESDIASGRVPATVASFSELHDYVDANGYGRAFDWPCSLDADSSDDAYLEAQCTFWNRIQNTVDAWIKAGRKAGV